MNRQNAAFVFVFKNVRPFGSCLEPSGVMISGVVIADRRVIPAARKLEIVAQGPLEKHPLKIRLEGIVRMHFEDHFGQEPDSLGEVGRNKEVRLSDAE